MMLDKIRPIHIYNASQIIDEQGVPTNNVWSQYYVVVNQKEYPFKHLIRTAYKLATGSELSFQSNESSRNFIERIGFEFSYYEDGYNFFTKQELDFYASIVSTDYRKDNSQHQFYKQKLYPIIIKAEYWAEKILIEGFNIRKDRNWLNGHVAKIKPYFWPRIYSQEDKDIFFNVKVNGADRFIGFKLDGYIATTKSLSESNKSLLQEYKESINWEWPRISFDELKDYNWEKLIAESKSYLSKYLPYHDDLKKLLSKETKICRITWNTNGWIKPSGRNGKSKYDGFEKDNGYGHEEWLFDGDKSINGYIYGFLEPINKYREKYTGNFFDLLLYARNTDSKESFWVAKLNDVEVISSEEAERVFKHYVNHGWYDKMKNDLYNLNLDYRALEKWVSEGAEKLFNIKFKKSEINNVFNELIQITDDSKISSNRYTLLNVDQEFQNKIEESKSKRFSFENSGSEEADLSSKSKRTGRKREIELELTHNIIQERFLKYLQEQHGKQNVKRECKAFGGCSIDITRKTETGYIFYEIKTYNSLKTSVREGIGQLLEYALYPKANEAEKLTLVSHIKPNEEFKMYFLHLRNYIKLPISFIHFDHEKLEIISEF